MKRFLLAVVSIVLAACVSYGQPRDSFTAQKTFESIQALVGDWEAKLESGKIISANYKMMSNNSAMVETYTTPSGKQTITVYHLDGNHLMLTHYCAQGNQPRLRCVAKKSTKSKFVFEYYDSTNLSSRDAARMVFLEAEILDADHFDQTTTYRSRKEQETTTLHFERVKKQP